MPDPAHVRGTPEEIEAAFEATYAALERRIQRLLELPIDTLSASELAAALNRIGNETA